MLKDDGDIVRGLGFVTLYSAYVEEQVDFILAELAPIDPFEAKQKKWPISLKLTHTESLIKKLSSPGLQDLEATISIGPELFNRRNLLVHGRIYAGFTSSLTLRSARDGVLDRVVTSSELYQLANDMCDYHAALLGPRLWRLQQAVAAYVRNGKSSEGKS